VGASGVAATLVLVLLLLLLLPLLLLAPGGLLACDVATTCSGALRAGTTHARTRTHALKSIQGIARNQLQPQTSACLCCELLLTVTQARAQ
jgi:hypothetical protein